MSLFSTLSFALSPRACFRAVTTPESYRGLLTARDRADKLPPPQHLADFIKDGKLTSAP